MSEVQQETFHEDQGSVDLQQQHQLAAQQDTKPPAQTPSKRKRDSIDDSGEAEEGRVGTDGGISSRRTSFKQTSPNMSSFMPINPNTPQNPQYAYQPLNVAQQHSPNAMNGSSVLDAATHAAIAANAIHLGLPSLSGAGGGIPNYDTGKTEQQVESHTEAAPAPVAHPPPARQHSNPAPNPKPQVGTEEWHRVRRDNHKEVERRRRETINEGINELAKIVPGCEKNKGSILQRAVQYIQQLKESEAQNIEKWTLEKLLTEQAIQQLSQNNEKLQKECERAWREADTWKKSCLQAGITRENRGQDDGSS